MRGFGLFCAAEFEVGASFVGYKAPLFHGLSALRRARLTESLAISLEFLHLSLANAGSGPIM